MSLLLQLHPRFIGENHVLMKTLSFLSYEVLSVVDTNFGGSPIVGEKGLFHNGTITFDPLWLDARRRFQGRWSIADKGWLVPLRWGPAPNHGEGSIGVYAVTPIKAGTLIRKSTIDENNYGKYT